MIFHGSLRHFSVPDRNRIAYVGMFPHGFIGDLAAKARAENVNMNMKPREGVGDQMVAGALGNYFMKFGVKIGEGIVRIRIGANGAFQPMHGGIRHRLRGLFCQMGLYQEPEFE